MSERDGTAQPERSESHVIAERREKLARLRDSGVEPFPHSFEGRRDIASVRAAHEGLGAAEETEDRYRVAGRIAARRGHGKAAFLDLVDGSGRIQLHAREDVLGPESFEALVGLDLGDIVGAEGTVFATKRGELSLRVDDWTLLAKSLLPPPRAGPHRQSRGPRAVHQAGGGDRDRARVARRAGVRRGGDAGAPAAVRGSACAPVYDAPQRARPRPLSADRDRALPEAPDRRRHRPRL